MKNVHCTRSTVHRRAAEHVSFLQVQQHDMRQVYLTAASVDKTLNKEKRPAPAWTGPRNFLATGLMGPGAAIGLRRLQ
jgi:hypothetical protein